MDFHSGPRCSPGLAGRTGARARPYIGREQGRVSKRPALIRSPQTKEVQIPDPPSPLPPAVGPQRGRDWGSRNPSRASKHRPERARGPNVLKTREPLSEVHKKWHMTTGRSVETQEFLTKEPIALSSYALTRVALTLTGSSEGIS